MRKSRVDHMVALTAMMALAGSIDAPAPRQTRRRVDSNEPPQRLNHRGQPFTEADEQAIAKAKLRRERRKNARRTQK